MIFFSLSSAKESESKRVQIKVSVCVCVCFNLFQTYQQEYTGKEIKLYVTLKTTFKTLLKFCILFPYICGCNPSPPPLLPSLSLTLPFLLLLPRGDEGKQRERERDVAFRLDVCCLFYFLLPGITLCPRPSTHSHHACKNNNNNNNKINKKSPKISQKYIMTF